MPLSFDMPLKQLKTYNGTNPKPLDFDSFWERKLYEVNKIDPEINIVIKKNTFSFLSIW